MNDLISVIIPVYNEEHIVINTLQSLEAQTYDNLEVIIIAGGRIDGSAKVIRNYLKTSKLNAWYYYQSNFGVSSARNKGFGHSSGEYISFLNCGDTLAKDFYELMILRQATISISNILYKDQDVVNNQNFFNQRNITQDSSYFSKYYKLLDPLVANKLFKREVLQNVSFDNVADDDVAFFYEIISQVKSMGFVNTTYKSSKTSYELVNNLDISYDNFFIVFENILKFHKDQATFKQYESILYYIFKKYLYGVYLRKIRKVVNLKQLLSRYNNCRQLMKDNFKVKLTMVSFSKVELYLKFNNKFVMIILWILSNLKNLWLYLLNFIKYLCFNKKHYYQQLDKMNYKSVFVNDLNVKKRLNKPYFCINYQNYLYGIGLAFKHLNLNEVYIEHQYDFSNILTNNYLALFANQFICTTSNRQKLLEHRYGVKAIINGSYIKQVSSFYSSHDLGIFKKKYGKVLLVFPTYDSKINFNINKFKLKINETKSMYSIDTVFICLNYEDLVNGIAKDYQEYEVVCAGHKHDIYYLAKLKSLIMLSDYTISNKISNDVVYCFNLNKPHMVISDILNQPSNVVETQINNEVFNDGFVYYESKKVLVNKYFELENLL